MMVIMDGRKLISFLLLLGFSVLLGHSLAPHHHHSGIPVGAVTDACPEDNDGHHDSDENPLHCHAFNNVDFFKDSPTNIQQEPKVISTFMLPFTKITAESPSAFGTLRYICLKLPDQSIKYSGAVSLRAPPYTV